MAEVSIQNWMNLTTRKFVIASLPYEIDEGQAVVIKGGSGGQFFNRYIFQEALGINPEHFDHRLADPSISFAPGSPICHPLGSSPISGLLILLPGNVTPYPSDEEPLSLPKRSCHFRASAYSYMAYQR